MTSVCVKGLNSGIVSYLGFTPCWVVCAAECHCRYYSSTVGLAVFFSILVVVMVILQVLLLRKRC